MFVITFVFIHSPLVSAFTWSRVADEMQRRAIPVLVPPLRETAGSAVPLWKQYAESVADALRDTPPETNIILVGHSAAGPLLPAVGAYSPRLVEGYVFVDAGILFRDASQLDLRAAEDIERAWTLEAALQNGARVPQWSSEDLSDDIPDREARERVVQELQPRGLEFFLETLPVFDFPNAPCAYLQFTEWYDPSARQAQEREWAYQRIEAGHFHMLVDPVAVTDALLALTTEMLGNAPK